MKLQEIFAADVTRDIAPVVYFHEQDPERLEDEISEYVITGGYPEGHPHHQRVPNGIHEQFVKLLTRVREELDKPRGADLPNSWISGFYGSGKSSFAKLFGLSLDGRELPDGTTLANRLLERDKSPKAEEFQAAWEALLDEIDPIATVFDLGWRSRGDEPVHAVVIREIQRRLGYCPTKDPNVAAAELKIERNGDWDVFTEAVVEELGARWEEIRDSEFIEDKFSRVLHRIYPDDFPEPKSWMDSRFGRGGEDRSPEQAVEDIDHMLERRAPGKTLFIVVDEVSQYIHNNRVRTDKLRAFAEALGQHLEGRAWLFALGQEKLEEVSESTVLGHMKDRFPPKFRVHLETYNIRDVVHKRLLRKDAEHRDRLKRLYDENRHNLQNYAYGCEDISQQEFLEVYPMLPNHIDLLMRINSAMRAHSNQIQRDADAIRGVMGTLSDLFKRHGLADEDVGRLVAIDDIYKVQSTDLSNDTRRTMDRIRDFVAKTGDELAMRVAKAVALLQLIQKDEPTSAELVSRCLYDRVDRGDVETDIEEALERLRDEHLLTYSEERGYRLQSSAGQEWVNEREDIGVSYDDASEHVREQLGFLVDNTAKAELKGVKFDWEIYFSDNRNASDEHIRNPRSQAVATVDFRLVGSEERRARDWIQMSDGRYENRIVWVVGRSKHLVQTARKWGRSQRMVQRYEPIRESLEAEKHRLLGEEQARTSRLKNELRRAVEDAWMEGQIYFRGQEIAPLDRGSVFSEALRQVADSKLSSLYPYFDPVRVTKTELEQLFDESLAGISRKFLETNIGIVSMDAGSRTVTCEGEIPRRILEYIEDNGGAGGASLLEHFEGIEYGYHRSLIKVCLAGLLRAGKIEIQPQGGKKITSYRDPGSKKLIDNTQELRSASFMPAGTGPVSNRDRVKICKFFEKRLDRDVEREDEAIADAVFKEFRALTKRQKEVISTFEKLPDAVTAPEKLVGLGEALGACRSSRQIQETVERVNRQLDLLHDGVELLLTVDSELQEAERATLRDAARARNHYYAQLVAVHRANERAVEAADEIDAILVTDFPWRNGQSLRDATDILEERYTDVRSRMLERQAEVAENARNEIKQRDGYRSLSGDDSNRVLRPVALATVDTDAKALHPTLSEIQSAIEIRIPEALGDAHDRLDEILEDDKPVRKVRTRLRNRTVEDEDELEAVLDELEERAKEHLEQGNKVRFI